MGDLPQLAVNAGVSLELCTFLALVDTERKADEALVRVASAFKVRHLGLMPLRGGPHWWVRGQ